MPRCCDVPFCIALTLVFGVNATPQELGTRWECDPKDVHARFYRADLGVVCWEGTTYSKDNGGIPQSMLDYFEQNRRNVQQKVDEMNKHIAELKASRQGNSGTPRPTAPTAGATGTVARADSAPIVPVSLEAFEAIDVGMPRSEVLDKLGKPAGSITIPGDDGMVEIWTWQLTDGATAKVHLEKGVVTSRGPKAADHGR
jgi:hypothetical protein